MLGSKAIEMEDNHFNVKNNFDQLIGRIIDGSQSSTLNLKPLKAQKNPPEMFLNIRTDENSLRSRLESLHSSTQGSLNISHHKKTIKAVSKKNYTGEMKNNVRNGKNKCISIFR